MRIWLAALFLVGVSVTAAFKPLQVPRGCVPFAAQYQYSYAVREALQPYAWCRIIRVERRDNGAHALAIFALKNGDVWAYDTLRGSDDLRTRSHELREIIKRLREIDSLVESGEWID